MNQLQHFFIILLTASCVSSFCPSGCQCDDTGLKVRCLGVGITIVPILLSPGLERLYLSYNIITSITDAFEFYEWLEDLDLSHNSIVSLGDRNFEQQLDMKELRLGHNNISKLTQHSFKGLISLHYIDLSYNNLIELPHSFMPDSSKLKILKLSNNNILTMSPKAFRGLRSLRALDLCNNRLRRVPGATLEAVSSTIDTLQICRNRIKGIEPDDFPTPLLKFLSLDSNFITFIDPISFVLLGGLQKLNLNNNNLKEVPTRAFTSLLSINSLYLSRNNISVIRDRAFKGLSRLSHLEVSGCPYLERLAPYALSSCVNLKVLKLSHNEKLKFLPNELFKFQQRLHNLEMRSNAMETLPQQVLPWQSLKTLDIRNNPLVCNCSLKWLLRALKAGNSSLAVTDVVCTAPKKLQGHFLSTAYSNQLNCLNQIQLVMGVVIVSVASALLVALGVLLCKDRGNIPEWKPGVKKLRR